MGGAGFTVIGVPGENGHPLLVLGEIRQFGTRQKVVVVRGLYSVDFADRLLSGKGCQLGLRLHPAIVGGLWYSDRLHFEWLPLSLEQ